MRGDFFLTLAHRLGCIALPALLLGCSSTPPPPMGTGAREAVVAYYDALARRDFAAAYALLHPDSQKQVPRDAFVRRADTFCAKLGFTLGTVHLRSCDEQDEKAIAQLILSDVTDARKHRYREGAVLRKIATGWGVVLPKNFGQR